MKQFCQTALEILSTVKGEKWAEEYVRLRMEFHRKHARGLILSTWYSGTEFFAGVLNCLDGGEYDEPKGEYRNNFLKVISFGQAEA